MALTTDRRLWVKDGTVYEDDAAPSGATLLVAEGNVISDQDASLYGLTIEDGKLVLPGGGNAKAIGKAEVTTPTPTPAATGDDAAKADTGTDGDDAAKADDDDKDTDRARRTR